MSEDLVRVLEVQVAKERACALAAVAALREVAVLLEQRLEGDALEAAAEACATVAAKHAKRGQQIGTLATGLGAIVAGQCERRAAEGLQAAAGASVPRTGDSPRPPPAGQDGAPTDDHAGKSCTTAPSEGA